MSTLLIDAGNTAVKWRLLGETVQEGRFSYDHPQELPSAHRIVGCCVASEHRRRTIESCCPGAVEWLETGCRSSILVNGYRACAALGADRWFGALGAVHRYGCRCMVLVHCGTCLVADTLLPQKDGTVLFAGGRIAPGLQLMWDSLVQRTALLTYTRGEVCSQPVTTADAIETGVAEALCGPVWGSVAAACSLGFEPIVALCGGDSQRILAHLQGIQAELLACAVLDGLQVATGEER